VNNDLNGGIQLTLPMPPSLNVYWRKFRNRMVISDAGLAFRTATHVICQNAEITPFQGRIAVTVKVYRPANRGDLDNSLKAILDALNQCAYRDDSQIDELHAYKYLDRANPRVEVEVRELA
jgi:crossover junction endodeoxyribonuclease RusA